MNQILLEISDKDWRELKDNWWAWNLEINILKAAVIFRKALIKGKYIRVKLKKPMPDIDF